MRAFVTTAIIAAAFGLSRNRLAALDSSIVASGGACRLKGSVQHKH
jgi:hypothetical protein